jgi:beta-glucuronidase
MLTPQVNYFRATTSLNGVWDFRFQWQETDATGWEKGFTPDRLVAVPASFNDLFTTYEERNHWGPVWYQREIQVPGCWHEHKIFLRFGAAAYLAEVWIDGILLGGHETGHTPFEFDVSSVVRPGNRHRLVVRVDTRLTPDCVPTGELSMPGTSVHMGGNRPPGNFDFFPYGGLQRSVELVAVPHRHLQRIRVDTCFQDAHAEVSFRILQHGGATLRITIEESGEQTVQVIAPEETYCTVMIHHARRWDVGRGELYHARVELLDADGNVVDSYRQRFGCREVSIAGDRLLLNGYPVYLKGFGRHEDFPVLGRGHNDAVMVRDFELLKWIGANSFRTSHYPYAEEQLDLADQLGIMVISESPAVGIVPDLATERTLSTHMAVQKEYMLRDYNHPSVIAWSVANEPLSFQETAPAYFKPVVAAAREVDAKRPIMFVTFCVDRDRCLDLFDMIGINSYTGWYGGGDAMPNSMNYASTFLDTVKKLIPDKPVMMTEFGADAVVGFHGLPEEMWTEEYQAELITETIKVIRSKPWMNGEHVWAFCDFRTGQNDRRAYGNRKGVFTRDRLPKMAAHALRAIWNPDTRTKS